MRRYRLLIPASEELESIVDYYAGIKTSLAVGFLDEFDQGMDLICSYPQAWGRLDENHRRFLIRRFPYGIIYCLEEEQILVTSIMHLQRDPESWKDRR